MSKPLAKALHTVTVLVNLARHLRAVDPSSATVFDLGRYVNEAAAILGYGRADDPHGLKLAALRVFEKGEAAFLAQAPDAPTYAVHGIDPDTDTILSHHDIEDRQTALDTKVTMEARGYRNVHISREA